MVMSFEQKSHVRIHVHLHLLAVQHKERIRSSADQCWSIALLLDHIFGDKHTRFSSYFGWKTKVTWTDHPDHSRPA